MNAISMLMDLAPLVFMASTELTLLTTSDGARISLFHLPADGPPVLLLHGLAANHRTWDLDGHGLAGPLQRAGYDVWMVDLRGRLDSVGGGGPRRWDLDDYGQFDVETALSHISDSTQAATVACIGHSMGGMVLATHHSFHGSEKVGPVIILGSPLDFSYPDPVLTAGAVAMRLGQPVRKIQGQWASKAASIFPKTPLIDAFVGEPGATSRKTRRDIYRTVVAPMNAGEMAQLARTIDEGSLVSEDGNIHHVDNLSTWTSPLLVVAGRTDRIAPPDRVVTWVDAVASEDVTWWVPGRANGLSHEYGHVDLVLADDVETTIAPMLLEWLAPRWPLPTPDAPQYRAQDAPSP